MIRKTNIHNVSQTLSQIGKTISAQNNNKQLNLQSDSFVIVVTNKIYPTPCWTWMRGATRW